MGSLHHSFRCVANYAQAFFLVLFLLAGLRTSSAQQKTIPDVLKPWEEWVLWDTDNRRSPSPFDDSNQRIRTWPSTLRLDVFQDRCEFQFLVNVFDPGWVLLPGDPETWPLKVESQEGRLPVLLRDAHPAVRLLPGEHRIRGEFLWSEMPQKLTLPKSIGIVSLRLDGKDVPFPNWDSAGRLWLKRQQNEESQQNLLSIKLYRVIEDGIPIWLRTKVELSVSGRNREEDLGCILPDGWQLSSVESLLPVAVDEQGRMKVQVRPGTWSIQIDAFRNQDLDQFRYPDGLTPAVATELIGFRSQPQFRIAEIAGLPAIDVQQTTFPDPWRALPVYQWATNSSFTVVEKMRGMGSLKPRGLAIHRRFWLDDDGKGITYQDQLKGELQQTWRLDSAPGHELGVVRIDQQRQLITANPINGSPGVEIRSRNPNLIALGRIEPSKAIAANGWQADASSLQLLLMLPPGWRVLTVLGADQVDGDWLTAWSLLDLFLVLVFSMAVYRIWGIPAGLLALFAFGLSYHEPGSPRWTWLFLLMPIALLRVVGEGSGRGWIHLWRNVALALLLLNLVPFLARQVQFFLYPQLEPVGISYAVRPMFPWTNATYEVGARLAEVVSEDSMPTSNFARLDSGLQLRQSANLAFDPAVRTQTGPAMPEWVGNEVQCRWDGPVTRDQQVTPIYLSRNVNRLLTIVRCLLLLLLAALLIRMKSIFDYGVARFRFRLKSTTTALLISFLVPSVSALGQIPDPAILKTLRDRLLETSDSFPNAASIAKLDIAINDGKLRMNLEVHTAIEVAVPVPGKLPIWSPVSVRIAKEASFDDSSDALVCRRDDGYLWVVVPQGVHFVRVEGNLADANEWVLSFPLVPHRVSIEAPQWRAIGLQPNGVPENQLFFSRIEKTGEDEAKYDQRLYRPIVIVERRLEIGLIWKIQNTVTRLSAPGKAIALKIPLLDGERIVSSTTNQPSNTIDVNLAADQSSFHWESEMDIKEQLQLKAAATDQFVERWVLVSSPIWNIIMSGAQPIYETDQRDLIPVWQIWPGEEVVLGFLRPTATEGETITVRRVTQSMSLGTRQRTTQLRLEVESSLGGDFVIDLEKDAEMNSLSVANRKQPVRRIGSQLVVPLMPGVQSVEMNWATNEAMQALVRVSPVVLPVPSANVTTVIHVPETRWVLWTNGPMRGPAVRFWIFLTSAILFAMVLGNQAGSPLRIYEWVLLALGLTQLHAAAGLIVVAWLFALSWRGRSEPKTFSRWQFNFLQIGLVLLTFVVFGILIVVVGKGLLGDPEMFIVGNGSSRSYLAWYESTTGRDLPRPSIVSVSVWFYRLVMLLWALWLATALLRWLQSGWHSFSYGGRWLRKPPKNIPPPLSQSH